MTVTVICHSRRKLAQHPLLLSVTSEALPFSRAPLKMNSALSRTTLELQDIPSLQQSFGTRHLCPTFGGSQVCIVPLSFNYQHITLVADPEVSQGSISGCHRILPSFLEISSIFLCCPLCEPHQLLPSQKHRFYIPILAVVTSSSCPSNSLLSLAWGPHEGRL